MGYDESLAQTMRAALGQGGGISEKRMMGAICFFLNGNMVGGVDRPKGGTDRFMFRVGKNNEAAIKVVDYLTGAEGMKAWSDLGLAMPTRASLRDGWLQAFPDLAPFLAGADLSLADLHLAPVLAYFTATPEGQAQMPGYPKLPPVFVQGLVGKIRSFKAP